MLRAGAAYQSSKFKRALEYTQNRRTALDIGAHCGLWSMQMDPVFDRVIAFEPLERHIECLKKNVDVELYEHALGDSNGTCGVFVVESSSGRSHVDGLGSIPIRKLDDFAFENVDFIKIDCEGFEYFVIKGGEQTILRCKPVMVVEQKPGHGSRFGVPDQHAIEYLEGLGAEVRAELAGDFIMTFC